MQQFAKLGCVGLEDAVEGRADGESVHLLLGGGDGGLRGALGRARADQPGLRGKSAFGKPLGGAQLLLGFGEPGLGLGKLGLARARLDTAEHIARRHLGALAQRFGGDAPGGLGAQVHLARRLGAPAHQHRLLDRGAGDVACDHADGAVLGRGVLLFGRVFVHDVAADGKRHQRLALEDHDIKRSHDRSGGKERRQTHHALSGVISHTVWPRSDLPAARHVVTYAKLYSSD